MATSFCRILRATSFKLSYGPACNQQKLRPMDSSHVPQKKKKCKLKQYFTCQRFQHLRCYSYMDKTSRKCSPMKIVSSVQICFSLFPSRYCMFFKLFLCQIWCMTSKLKITNKLNGKQCYQLLTYANTWFHEYMLEWIFL